jgi:hypothetical protein
MSAPPPPPLVPQVPDPQGQGSAPFLFGGRLSRRRLFKVAGFGGLALAGGAWVAKTLWRLGPPAKGRVCLTEDEYAINEKVAEAFFPGPPYSPFSAADIGLPAFVDSYIGGLYEDSARLFKMLYRALNLSTVLTFGRSFYWLDLPQRRQVLETWQTSNLLARRASYQSMLFVYSMGYFEDDGVRGALGFKFGCDLSQRQPLPVRSVESIRSDE